MIQEVDKLVQLAYFLILHAARRSHEARAEIARWLGDGHGAHRRLFSCQSGISQVSAKLHDDRGLESRDKVPES